MSAFLDGAAVFATDLTAIVVRGADAPDYLQRMVSADLRKLEPGGGGVATLLTGKGKLIAAFDVYPLDSEFVLVVETSAVEELVAQIERSVILEDVEVMARAEAPISVQGPRAKLVIEQALGEDGIAPSSEWGYAVVGDLLVARRARSEAGGWDLVGLSNDDNQPQMSPLIDSLKAAGGGVVTSAAAEAARIDAGVGRFGVDSTSANLPPESGYDGALSYDKGCYAGQEIVARIRTYGHVNKVLRRLRLTGGSPPAVGTELLAGDRTIGTITSSALSPRTSEPVALGYVRYEHGEPGTEVFLATDPTQRATVEDLWKP